MGHVLRPGQQETLGAVPLEAGPRGQASSWLALLSVSSFPRSCPSSEPPRKAMRVCLSHVTLSVDREGGQRTRSGTGASRTGVWWPHLCQLPGCRWRRDLWFLFSFPACHLRGGRWHCPSSHCSACARSFAEPGPALPPEVASLSLDSTQNQGQLPPGHHPALCGQRGGLGGGGHILPALPQTSRKQPLTTVRQASPGRRALLQRANPQERGDQNADAASPH